MPVKTAGVAIPHGWRVRLHSRLTTENEILIFHCYIPVSVVRHVMELLRCFSSLVSCSGDIPSSSHRDDDGFSSPATPPFADVIRQILIPNQ